ncbi:MAG: helix-turn-helix domain-containing protein [Tannerella sp.]|jgi:hypothetical protein|nr:helix-turn-helix domain-containing protein [Tannerella sp.]
MNIKEILNETNITVSVGLNDLKEFAKDIIQQTKREMKDLVVAENTETYISRQRASEMLEVDPSTLWRWAKQDYLVPVSVGGKKRYRMSDINNRLLNR